jgi:hypothetical protein
MGPKRRAQPTPPATIETARLETGMLDILANPERMGSPRLESDTESVRSARSERSVRSARSARSERSVRSARSERPERAERAERDERAERAERAERPAPKPEEILAQIDDVAPRTESQRQRDAYVKLQRLASMPGIRLTRTFEVTDKADDLEAEIHLHEAILRDRMLTQQTDDGVRFARRMLLAFTSFTEFMNKRYDPFGIDISGWSDSVMHSISDYDAPFKRLIAKYRGTAEMAPELELVITLGSSMFMFHLSKSLAARMAADMPIRSPKQRRRARTQVVISDASSSDASTAAD